MMDKVAVAKQLVALAKSLQTVEAGASEDIHKILTKAGDRSREIDTELFRISLELRSIREEDAPYNVDETLRHAFDEIEIMSKANGRLRNYISSR